MVVRQLVAGLVAVLMTTGCGGGGDAGGADAPRQAASQPSPYPPTIGPQSEAARNDPRAQIFLTKGCPQCHQITALGVASPTSMGPDLTQAVADVQSRFGVPLDSFMRNPTGTMQIVLAAQIQLTPVERDSIVKLLRALNPNP